MEGLQNPMAQLRLDWGCFGSFMETLACLHLIPAAEDKGSRWTCYFSWYLRCGAGSSSPVSATDCNEICHGQLQESGRKVFGCCEAIHSHVCSSEWKHETAFSIDFTGIPVLTVFHIQMPTPFSLLRSEGLCPYEESASFSKNTRSRGGAQRGQLLRLECKMERTEKPSRILHKR